MQVVLEAVDNSRLPEKGRDEFYRKLITGEINLILDLAGEKIPNKISYAMEAGNKIAYLTYECPLRVLP